MKKLIFFLFVTVSFLVTLSFLVTAVYSQEIHQAARQGDLEKVKTSWRTIPGWSILRMPRVVLPCTMLP